MPNPGSTTDRGYGYAHRKLRREWSTIVADGEAYCTAVECVDPDGTGRWIMPDALWDLGHSADRTVTNGPEHRRCNRRDGAVRRNAAHRQSAPVEPSRRALPTSEDWWG